MLKLVLDTNLYISGILYHGIVKNIFDLVNEDKLYLLVSTDLRLEVFRKFKEFTASTSSYKELALFFEDKGIKIVPNVKVSVCRDPEDNFILELAETARADYIVTRDKDLLDMKKWRSTSIVKPESLLPILRKMRLIS